MGATRRREAAPNTCIMGVARRVTPLVLCAVLGASLGCGLRWPRFPVVRTGPPVSGVATSPISECERESWLFAAAALASGDASDEWDIGSREHHQAGTALYRYDPLANEGVGEGPLVLTEALPALAQRPWLRRQLAPAAGLSRRRTATWSLAGSAAVLLFGVGPWVALANNNDDPSMTTGEAVGFSLMGIGMAAALAAWIAYPSREERVDEDVREQLALGDEAQAALRAEVAEHNGRLQRRCR